MPIVARLDGKSLVVTDLITLSLTAKIMSNLAVEAVMQKSKEKIFHANVLSKLTKLTKHLAKW